MKKICIQGYEGSFHQEAARSFYGKDVDVIACDTFRELIRKAEDVNASDGAVMAIENSIAGSILPNYTLLLKSDLKIVGEVYLHIRQQLLANKDVKLEDIREVHSHPMALLQCMEYLETHPNWKLVESEDTALSAKHIYQHHKKTVAAIASPLAAELYNLNIIAPDIHTMKNNYTRFLVLERPEDAKPVNDANKASVNFVTIHQKGALAKVLTAIAMEGVNLSKLQSMPIPGSNFQYSFHADMEFDTLDQFNTLMDVLTPLTNSLRVLGVYKNGNGISFK